MGGGGGGGGGSRESRMNKHVCTMHTCMCTFMKLDCLFSRKKLIGKGLTS